MRAFPATQLPVSACAAALGTANPAAKSMPAEVRPNHLHQGPLRPILRFW